MRRRIRRMVRPCRLARYELGLRSKRRSRGAREYAAQGHATGRARCPNAARREPPLAERRMALAKAGEGPLVAGAAAGARNLELRR
jgi:hypothetical protein